MFGEKSGEEQYQGVMNQYVVSKLSGAERNYWVFHKRGENAVSVLIQELTKLKLKDEHFVRIVRSVQTTHQLTVIEWESIREQQADRDPPEDIFGWGTDKPVLLHKEVSSSPDKSRVIGWEKGPKDE